MDQNGSPDIEQLRFDWEREKFNEEMRVKASELDIERGKQVLERRRLWFVGIGVPVTLALVTALPTAISNYYRLQSDSIREQQQIAFERVQAEAQIELESAKFQYGIVSQALSGESHDDRVANLRFLVRAGFLKDPNGRIMMMSDDEIPLIE